MQQAIARRGSLDDSDEDVLGGGKGGGGSGAGARSGGRTVGRAADEAVAAVHGSRVEEAAAGASGHQQRSQSQSEGKVAFERAAAAAEPQRSGSATDDGSVTSGAGVDEWWHSARRDLPVNEDALRSGSITTDDGESVASGSASDGEGSGARGMPIAGGDGRRKPPARDGMARQHSLVTAARDEFGGTPAARAGGLLAERPQVSQAEAPTGRAAAGASRGGLPSNGANAVPIGAHERGGSISSGTGTDGEYDGSYGRQATGSVDSGTSGREAAASFVD